MSDLIVFDLDGVITSEEAYWDAGGLTLHELLYSPRYWNVGSDREYRPATTAEESRHISRSIFPESEIMALKARAINSNWDTCYAAVCLCLIDLLKQILQPSNTHQPNENPTNLRRGEGGEEWMGGPLWREVWGTSSPAAGGQRLQESALPLFPLRPWDADWLAAFREQISQGNDETRHPKAGDHKGPPHATQPPSPLRTIENIFESPIFHGYIGLELINRFDAYASEILERTIEGVFSRYSPFWGFCQNIFQEWYLGDDLYTVTYGYPPAQPGKPGTISFERPLLPLEEVRATLETLCQQGYTLGLATGRMRQEAVYPLKTYGLLKYFDDQHISTYDDVEQAEVKLRRRGDQTLLTKPHPFPFLVAFDRDYWETGMPIMETEAEQGQQQPGWGQAPPLLYTDREDSSEYSRGGACPHPGSGLPGSGLPDSGLPGSGRPGSGLSGSGLPDSRNRPIPRGTFIIVGDSTSDILGGRAAGALTVAVLTGARTPEAHTLLAQSEPDFTINDMTKLPALLVHIDNLSTIQRMQFSERGKAERLLRWWFERHMKLVTESVTLTPKAVSLNSFNGFYRADGEEYFFKTHVEEQGILEEYYHAKLLSQAGYNIVKPLRMLHEKEQQMVIYPVIHWPVMFDLVRSVETGKADDTNVEMLVATEQQECERLLNIYKSTFAASTAEEHASAPIHQLFWHRLTGGRFTSFYEGKAVPLPHNEPNPEISTPTPQSAPVPRRGRFIVPTADLSASSRQSSPPMEHSIPFDQLLKYHWIINGIAQQQTLGELVERAKIVLNPAQPAMTIIGHGDAHFGNVFLESTKYLYFDPAFAGRHSPLLDVVKPLFHNVFATWMYFPQEIAQKLQLSVQIHDGTISIAHDYTLTPIRRAILRTKREHLLIPLIEELRSLHALPANWAEVIQLALMCCPLLTINLLDGTRMPPSISWLGLSQAVQMGNNGIESNEF